MDQIMTLRAASGGKWSDGAVAKAHAPRGALEVHDAFDAFASGLRVYAAHRDVAHFGHEPSAFDLSVHADEPRRLAGDRHLGAQPATRNDAAASSARPAIRPQSCLAS